ncbi:hypothetical protein AKJ41_04335 [candidate division MSBL1 archaeon SCGC-AAA259O05]|uniref:Uncharacterized protein n=1 Tax=candidate division MSBL1 archaeon SCGC-AAA259O05 TaxID=1698271 RepID=A0A133V126_9EURY|nr:hypothetical protein AKJ41_04335 [candidate division MSBL1 archaeon SCGC-AAA259O05]
MLKNRLDSQGSEMKVRALTTIDRTTGMPPLYQNHAVDRGGIVEIYEERTWGLVATGLAEPVEENDRREANVRVHNFIGPDNEALIPAKFAIRFERQGYVEILDETEKVEKLRVAEKLRHSAPTDSTEAI